MPEEPQQLEFKLDLTASPDVKVTRFPGGEVRLKPCAPQVEGTVRDAARVLKMSPRTIRRMLEENELPGFKPGKRKWVVDMIAVYERRQRRQQEQREK